MKKLIHIGGPDFCAVVFQHSVRLGADSTVHAMGK